MPRDKREFLTFPIDFDEHPIVASLSDAAFRTFIAMNGYSRRLKLDGVIPVKVARLRWKLRALNELVQSHPEKPLVLLDGDNYVIRSYADHQFTTSDAAELREKRAAAGAKGGRAKASNVLANAYSLPKQNEAESRVKSQELRTIDSAHLPNSSPVSNAPESDSISIQSIKEQVIADADAIGINNLIEVRSWFEDVLHIELNMRQTLELSETILGKASSEVRNVDGYLRTVCSRDPQTVADGYQLLDLEAVA